MVFNNTIKQYITQCNFSAGMLKVHAEIQRDDYSWD